jgi:hypothetical protein
MIERLPLGTVNQALNDWNGRKTIIDALTDRGPHWIANCRPKDDVNAE